MMKIAAAALNQTPLDWEGNTNRILNAISEARKQKAELLILPELCLTGYGCDDYFFMPWVIEKAHEILIDKILPQTKGMLVAIGIPLFHHGQRFNTLALIEDQVLKGFYAKQILARQGVYYEPRWFDAWPANVSTSISYQGKEVRLGDFTIRFTGIQIGFEICEDAWNPSRRPAIYGAAKDADLILNASASNFGRGKQSERHQIITSLKGLNDAYYLYTNLLGNESGRLIFDGEIIFGTDGRIITSGSRFSMQDVVVECFEIEPKAGLSFQAETEEDEFEDFTAACSLALLDYLRKAGSKGFALSLSGGADSATCALLVSEMIKRGFKQLGKAGLEEKLGFKLSGKETKDWCEQLLYCAYQGTENSGDVTRNAAETVANELGATFATWEIDKLVQGYIGIAEKALGKKLSWETDDLVLQNIQARTRAPGIWMMANALNLLLITTSNRSEGDVGYCTMDGDTAGSLAPIAGVSKHFVRQWLVWAKETLGYSSLGLIINQAPTAELRPQETKQTDEADLMPYDLLEAIEFQLIYKMKSETETLEWLKTERSETEKYLKQQVERFQLMWKRNQWKRERLAPSFHLDRFNIDPKSGGRFPILSK